jgi:predicted component of type VI protein secretion system
VRKLTIYRGEALISEVPLTGKTVRLGRSKENDVVLEDPGKGVSRTHAELRLEGDRYRLVDLESQNGIWVSGERVPSVVLAPGVVAAMGPFRVAINAASPVTQAIKLNPPDSLPDTGTEYSLPMPPATPAAPVAVAVDGPGALLDDPSPGTNPPLAPPAARPSAGAPAIPAPVAASASRSPRPSGGASRSTPPAIWVLVAVAVLAASGYGAYKLLNRGPSKPVWDGTLAMDLANSGRCQEALDQHINPALLADPANAEAQSLKQKCSAPPPTTSVPPTPVPDNTIVTKTNVQILDEADVALTAKDCQVALDAANTVLTTDPSDLRAKDLAAKATACLTPADPRRPPVADPVVKIAPADSGLDPLPGELGKDYKVRVNAVRKRYDDAVAQLQSQRYSQALREFEAIAAGVPQGYRELAQRRGEARNGIRDEANRTYASGQQAEQASQWNTAIDRYQRARDLDGRDISADVARINAQKLKLGTQFCNDGRASFALGKNAEAAEKYSRVLELLPSDDACYIEAKERLSRIRR